MAIICKSDLLPHMPLNLIHQRTHLPPDPRCHLLELASQNVVFILTLTASRNMRGLQTVASTSTLSPFPDMGTRTPEGTMLTYTSGRVVSTGHQTVHDALVNINSLIRAFSEELDTPIIMIHGELTNLVASGRIAFQLCRDQMRSHTNARFTHKFDGTTFNASRVSGKPLRLSMFQSGRFNVPGVRKLEDAKLALVQNLGLFSNCRQNAINLRNSRITTRKRRRTRNWVTGSLKGQKFGEISNKSV